MLYTISNFYKSISLNPWEILTLHAYTVQFTLSEFSELKSRKVIKFEHFKFNQNLML